MWLCYGLSMWLSAPRCYAPVQDTVIDQIEEYCKSTLKDAGLNPFTGHAHALVQKQEQTLTARLLSTEHHQQSGLRPPHVHEATNRSWHQHLSPADLFGNERYIFVQNFTDGRSNPILWFES